MSGRMRKRQKGKVRSSFDRAAKSFHPPQKDNSVRQKKKARLNNYKDQSHQQKEDQ